MFTSMTGFGTGAAADACRSARVEVKAVNHRYLDVVLHLPHHYASCEDKVRALIAEHITRGRVEIFVVLEEFVSRERTVTLDKPLLMGYAKALAEAKDIVGPLSFNLEALLAVPGLFQVEELPDDATAAWPVLQDALTKALRDLVAMRKAEGERLQADMMARLDTIEGWLTEIQERVPAVVAEYKAKLTTRIADLLEAVPISEDRIATEIAIFADKACITEELVRAASHIKHFREACCETSSVGRKLDFLLQELNREVNTIASKAADGRIAQLVVSIKAELEKVREQAQNIE